MARDEPSAGETTPRASAWRMAIAIGFTLGLGAAGGFVFNFFSLPLPWMLGSMSFVTAGALLGLRVRMLPTVRGVMITVLGVMLGSAFTPEVIARMGQWVVTLSALAAWMAVSGLVALAYFRNVAGYDPVTAYFSAMPGGLNEMVLIGGAMGGDDRTISLTHAARIMFVVFTISFWFRYYYGLPTVSPATQVGLFDVMPFDVVILTLCAIVGALGAQRLRIPAAYMVGPMILSAATHLSGVTASKPPFAVIAVAQVVIGAAIGVRFVDVPWARVGRTVGHSLAAAVLMVSLTVITGLALERVTGLPLPALVLAFSPGGLAEMSLVALALGVDAAFVSTHHIARIILVVTLAPIIFRSTRRDRSPRNDR